MEALELALFMLSACAFGTLLFYVHSPALSVIPDPSARLVLMGIAMGVTASAIIVSPMGRRSGAHFNPVVSLTFLFSRQNPLARHAALHSGAVRWWSPRRSSHASGNRSDSCLAVRTLRGYPARQTRLACGFLCGVLHRTSYYDGGASEREPSGAVALHLAVCWSVDRNIRCRILARLRFQHEPGKNRLISRLRERLDGSVDLLLGSNVWNASGGRILRDHRGPRRKCIVQNSTTRITVRVPFFAVTNCCSNPRSSRDEGLAYDIARSYVLAIGIRGRAGHSRRLPESFNRVAHSLPLVLYGCSHLQTRRN